MHLACNKATARRCPIFIPPEKYRLLLKLQEEEKKRETEGRRREQVGMVGRSAVDLPELALG